MFVTLYAYRAKPERRQAIRSLFQQWQQLLRNWNVASTELLANCADPGDMILLVRFRDEEAAWAVFESSNYRAWYAQLVRLAEVGPTVSHYQNEQNEG